MHACIHICIHTYVHTHAHIHTLSNLNCQRQGTVKAIYSHAGCGERLYHIHFNVSGEQVSLSLSLSSSRRAHRHDHRRGCDNCVRRTSRACRVWGAAGAAPSRSSRRAQSPAATVVPAACWRTCPIRRAPAAPAALMTCKKSIIHSFCAIRESSRCFSVRFQ
jgi:hypothetical protein